MDLPGAWQGPCTHSGGVKLRSLISALALTSTLVALAACSAPAPRPTATPDATPISSSVGEELRADGWTLTVNSVTFDATAEVAAANEFNPAPDADQQYALVAVTLERTAAPSTALGIDVSLLIEGERVAPALAAAPTPLHLLADYTTGAPVAGQVAFLVPKGTDDAQVLMTVDSAQRFAVAAQ